MPENTTDLDPESEQDPQTHAPAPADSDHIQEFQQRMNKVADDAKAEAERQKQGWLDQARNRATRIETMTWHRNPRTVYAGMYVGMYILCQLVMMPLYGIVTGLGDAWFGTETSWWYPAIAALVSGMVIPALATLHFYDYFFETVEFWGTVITREGYKPLKAKTYLRPRPFFGINRYKQAKHSHKITGSDDKTITIPVQKAKSEEPAAGSPKTALTDRISDIEFAGRINLIPACDDIRDVLILFDVVAGEKPDKPPLEIAGERLAERVIAAMREFCSSLDGPQTFYEAIASSKYAAEVLKWNILREACYEGVEVESVVPRIQPPKIVQDTIDLAAKEDAERDRSLKDARTAAEARYIVQTGDLEPTPENMKEFSRDKGNHVSPNLALTRGMMVEEIANKDAVKFIDIGGSGNEGGKGTGEAGNLVLLLELLKTAGIQNAATAAKDKKKEEEKEDGDINDDGDA
jgi:hypothetical protein